MATTELNWLTKINFLYAIVAVLMMAQFSGTLAVKSFLCGWGLAVLNFELLKRLGLRLLALYRGAKLDRTFYVLAFGKFAFLGLVIALFSVTSWMQAIPFVLGAVTLIISGLGVGMKEFIYAR